ncbi:MAG: inorganic pyrophosphatase [Candidatus Omnitrophica bacterium]|nr:inorganic pyrophosphatase [Candidatus Omnitrophota bacterium]
MNDEMNNLWQSLALLLRSHPWHGISVGEDAPKMINAYIETVPSDTVKYEIDKKSGFLKVDRPQKFSSICPTLYGFIPQTYCSKNVAELCRERTGRDYVVGDDDPLDICVLTEKVISHGDIIIRAIPIGGFRMIDQGQADDKIIAIMHGDGLYSQWHNIEDCPRAFIDRLRHYFLTYKDLPGTEDRMCEITHVYGREEAMEVLRRSRKDYQARFAHLEAMMSSVLDD